MDSLYSYIAILSGIFFPPCHSLWLQRSYTELNYKLVCWNHQKITSWENWEQYLQCEEEKHHTWDKTEANTCQLIGQGFQGKYKTGKRRIVKNFWKCIWLEGEPSCAGHLASTEISPIAGNMIQQRFQASDSYEQDGRWEHKLSTTHLGVLKELGGTQ